MKRTLIKILIALAVLVGVGALFVRSARDARAEPFELTRTRLGGWTLALDPAPEASGVLLGLQPPVEAEAMLFNQVFARAGESLSSPIPPSLPLVLVREFDRARAGTMTSDALLTAARAAGLDSSSLVPRCMARRRISAPGVTREVYALRAEWPAFRIFREQVAAQMRAAGGEGLDPAALTPFVMVAATDARFGTWLPLDPKTEDDCFAPIALK